MIRLIDADVLDSVVLRLNTEENAQITRGEYKLIENVIFEFPTIDAEPVIRCGVCLKKRICLLYRDTHDENGFCAWAGRKDTDDK